jgi:hypothetical protein
MKRATKQKIAILAIITFIGFFLWGRAADAAEVGVGLGFSKNGATHQQVTLTSTDLRWYGSVTRIGGDRRHNYIYGRVAAGYRVNWRRDTRFSPYMKLGGVYFTKEPTDYISDSWAYDMNIGVRVWDIVELEYQHNSTAGRSSQNEGLDTVMVSVVLPFGGN